MIKKYSAFHTAALIFIAIILNFVEFEKNTYTANDFETSLGKAMFFIGILFIVLPVAINVLSMLGNMISRGKWLWVLATFMFAFLATVVYYFVEYRKQ